MAYIDTDLTCPLDGEGMFADLSAASSEIDGPFCSSEMNHKRNFPLWRQHAYTALIEHLNEDSGFRDFVRARATEMRQVPA